MAPKKKQKTTWFGFGSPPTRKKSKRARKPTRADTIASLKKAAAVAAVVCGMGGVAVGFRYMDRYVHAVAPVTQQAGALELISPPRWINTELQAKIAAVAGGYHFPLGDDTAGAIAARLQHLPWLYNIRIRTTESTVHVHADYRKPSALVKSGGKTYLLAMVRPDDSIYAAEWPRVVLLDYLELGTLPILEIKGFSAKGMPPVGGSWDAPEVTTAVELINVLARMDEISCREKPLLEELAAIDVFNFDGRKNKSDSHVILYAKDGTEIRWGAAYGKSRLYFEATEQEKLATLYTFYKEHNNTIQCIKSQICQYVELRNPQKFFPRPN
ncbi:MAG: hypothetical protein IH624_15210 [Phycisphaerae bacterium]|nr:hypothetical protein [Phycisphaerae bacterium]